jgi:hypothetical protein
MRLGAEISACHEASGISMKTRPVEQIGSVARSASSSASDDSSAVMSCCTRVWRDERHAEALCSVARCCGTVM